MARALRVDKSVVVSNTLETMYKALTDRRELARWFADGASDDVREGALIEFVWGSGPTARRSRARVLRLEPSRTVMLRWENGSAQSRDDYFAMTLETQKAGVLVSAVDFAARDTQAELEEVWEECLAKLKRVYDGKGGAKKPAAPAKPAAMKAAPAKPAAMKAAPAKPAAAKAAAAKKPKKK